MSKEHLKPVRTKEEAKERGRRGGIASGKARRKKRAMREAAKIFLDMAAKGNLKSNLEQFGVPTSEQTNQMALIARAFTLGMSGDVRAMEFLRGLVGGAVDPLNMDGDASQVQDDVTKAKIYIPDNGRD